MKKKILLMWVLSMPIFVLMAQDCVQGYYDLEGNANDSTSNSYDGTVSGAILTADSSGVANGAYSFDGVNDYIQFPVDFDYPERTVQVVFKVQNFSTTMGLIYTSDNPSMQYGNTLLAVLDNGSENVLRYITGGNVATRRDTVIDTGRWYTATFVIDSLTTRYYLDCKMIGEFTTYRNSSNDGSSGMKLGCNRNYSLFFNGEIDQVTIRDCALDSTEICASSDTTSTDTSGGVDFVGRTLNQPAIITNTVDGKVSVTFTSKTALPAQVEVRDMSGRLVYHKKDITSPTLMIDALGQHSGMYLLHITTNTGETSVHRIIR